MCVFIDKEKQKLIHSYTSFCVHLAGNMRIARACRKCWTPWLFPKIWIWSKKNGEKNKWEFLQPCQCNKKILGFKKEPVENVRPICQLRQDNREDDRAGTDALLIRRYAARLPPWGWSTEKEMSERKQNTKTKTFVDATLLGPSKVKTTLIFSFKSHIVYQYTSQIIIWKELIVLIPIFPASCGCLFETVCHPGLCVWS